MTNLKEKQKELIKKYNSSQSKSNKKLLIKQIMEIDIKLDKLSKWLN